VTEVSKSLGEKYAAFIEQIIADTLKGKISSKDYVYEQLVVQLRAGAGEIFERCLIERVEGLEKLLKTETDELRQAKAQRQLRALKPLQEAWLKYQQTQQTKAACSEAVSQLLTAQPEERLLRLLQILDTNNTASFSRQQIERLASELSQIDPADAGVNPATIRDLHQLSSGLRQGIATYLQLEPHLLSWLYDNPQSAVGFQSEAQRRPNPWAHWAAHVQRPLPHMLFTAQAQNQSAFGFAQAQTSLDLSAWVELMVLLRVIQNGLVAWFDKQPYSFQGGRNLAASTFLAFAMVWCELSNGLQQAQTLNEIERRQLGEACFQLALQILRAFAQRDNFPLYGGLLVTLGGEGWRETLSSLDKPLRAMENHREKARILTVLGYSQQWLGQTDSAFVLLQEALGLARQADDQLCEIASLNHLGLIKISQRDFAAAITDSQRALFLARQKGDTLGETYASSNLGYAEVRLLQQQEHWTLQDLEPCLLHLERGLVLAKKNQAPVPEVFCALGLGVGYLLLEQASNAKPYLAQSLEASVRTGNSELLGLSHTALAEANYQLNQISEAVLNAYLGLFLLEPYRVPEARQTANLIAALRGKLGQEAFTQIFEQQRSALVSRIGVEGFEKLANLA
jgi:tetratricopeptide (TPR) repeat protein